MSSRTAAVAASLLLLAGPAWANDQSTGVTPLPLRLEPADGGTSSTSGVILNGDEVRLTFVVTLKKVAAIWFDLPRFEWLGEGEPYPDRHFPELKVEVDGRSVVPIDDSAVTAQGRDITPLLREAGLDPFAIADTPPFVQAVPGRQAAFDRLVALGAVRRAPEGMLAAWSASRRVRVTPGEGVRFVTFRYTARPAFGLATMAQANVRWTDYCTTATGIARMLARRGLSGSVLIKRHVLPVALESVSPSTPTLRLMPRAGVATIVCGAGGRAVIDPKDPVQVRTGPDGAIRVLQISRPG